MICPKCHGDKKIRDPDAVPGCEPGWITCPRCDGTGEINHLSLRSLIMAKKKGFSFDPSMIDVVIQDVKDLSQPAQKLVADVVALLGGSRTKKKMGAKAVQPESCPDEPGDECDCSECLCCAYQCQIHALIATSKAMEALDAEKNGE